MTITDSLDIKVKLVKKYQGEAYLSISIVPQKSVLKYQTIIDSMLNSHNIKRNTTLIYMDEEKITAKRVDEEAKSANFL